MNVNHQIKYTKCCLLFRWLAPRHYKKQSKSCWRILTTADLLTIIKIDYGKERARNKMTSPSYKEVKVRNPLFDNIKAILITLVVFGHMLEYISITNEYAVIRAVLYSFHMPVFVFISGYFSNDQKDNYYKNTLIHCAVPYFIFNTVFAIIFSRKLIVDILTPRYLFWYLLSLLVWRVSVPLFRRIRFILPISIVLGLYCGVIHDADRFLSISRTISFMPYFIAGWMLANTKVLDHLQMIRKRFFTLTGIIMLVIVIFIQIYGLFPVKMY